MREDLFNAAQVTVAEAAQATGLPEDTIDAFLNGARRVDAEFDLRLGRYFGFSPGYFLRLQNAYDIDEARRESGASISGIRPRINAAAA